MLKTVMFNGEPREARPLTERDMAQGTLLRHCSGRATYRLLCRDGDEAVLRNVRYPDRIAAWPVEALARDFLVVT